MDEAPYKQRAPKPILEKKPAEKRKRYKTKKPDISIPRSRKDKSLQFDPKCQEATPEHLRIEIDAIFKQFLEDPNKQEYIFPADLNNLQRKYIHAKANAMNIISRSYGKEPNRHLHIKKRDSQIANQAFIIELSSDAQRAIAHFNVNWPRVSNSLESGPVQPFQSTFGKLLDCPLTIPQRINSSYEIMKLRMALPIFEHRETILNTINVHQVVILSSETGSGKTTQVPQYILEDKKAKKEKCKIICTQPRRISTVAAAERVSYEICDSLGSTVGYHIKLEQKSGYSTNLIYCTVGILLRNLMYNPKSLKNITHVIVDEIHERDKLSDFLLICIRRVLPSHPHLRVILMSATVDTTKFQNYFDTQAVLIIPGRLHPITIYFLNDILNMVGYCSPKMRQAMQKTAKNDTKADKKKSEKEMEDMPEVLPFIDDALVDYLNFASDYDYKTDYQEATAQLNVYFLGENYSVDYRHSETGMTALMAAAHLGDIEFVSRLCNMDADLNICDNVGRTVFDYAHENKNNVLDLLHYISQRQPKEPVESDELIKAYDKVTLDDVIDYDLIVAVICHIDSTYEEGSILVFLPGYDEIMLCSDKIEESNLDSSKYKVFYLHSSMNIRDQCDVFKKLPGQRKIILSTNIAETSITIEDVVYVIDVGKVKEKSYDSYNKISTLQTQWISQACAKQRSGRAGRVRPGYCFRLYSTQRFENMNFERVPELLRVSLEELCLHAKILAPKDLKIYEFLQLAPDPPSANSVKVAVENLQALGALDEEEGLTVLGNYLSQITVEPRIGKMLIYGVIFHCLEPILTLAAALAHKDPFQLPPQAYLKNLANIKRKELTGGVLSDHLIYLEVFHKWQEMIQSGKVRKFCEDYFISDPAMTSILETRRQLLSQLRALNFVTEGHIDTFNDNCNSWPVVKAVMCSAYYPNVAYPWGGHFSTRSEKKVGIHCSSVCVDKSYGDWLFYDEMIKNRGSFYIRGATVLTPLAPAVLCGVNVHTQPSSVSIDGFVEFLFANAHIEIFRNGVDELVKKVLLNPRNSLNEANNLVVSTLKILLESEETKLEIQQPANIGKRPKFTLKPFPKQKNGIVNRQNSRYNFNNHQVSYKNNYFPQKIRDVSTAHLANTLQGTSITSNRTNMVRTSTKPQHFAQSSSRQQALIDALTPREDVGATSLNFYNSNWVPPQKHSYEPFVKNEKYVNYEDNPLYIIIRAAEEKNVKIAQSNNRWVFAPQTEKKVVHFSKRNKEIRLVFCVKDKAMIMGIARFSNLLSDSFSKNRAVIGWIFKNYINFKTVRHLTNPYYNNKEIRDCPDGTVLEKNIAEELCRIFTEVNDDEK